MPQFGKTSKTQKNKKKEGRSKGKHECWNSCEEFRKGNQGNLTPPKEVLTNNVDS